MNDTHDKSSGAIADARDEMTAGDETASGGVERSGAAEPRVAPPLRAPSPEGEAAEDDGGAGTDDVDPDALTLGFARRFVAYKRPNLLLHSPERLLRLVSDAARPVQLVIAGKAHPGDPAGDAMIAEWLRFIHQAAPAGRAIFIPDYDLLLAEYLVQGVDLWINTPRRPWEASGTSGMKVLVNGGLNLSELDGWWAEAYAPEVGWALGDRQEHGDDPAWDAAEADALYALLEREVVPAFYARDSRGTTLREDQPTSRPIGGSTPRSAAGPLRNRRAARRVRACAPG